MRIDRLFLTDYKNLRDFSVDFDASSSRQVVVGRNGVGKSNLLEALAWIFRQLDLQEESTFGYVIEYHCNNRFVRVESTRGAEGDGYFRTYWLTGARQDPGTSPPRDAYRRVTQRAFYKMNRPNEAGANPERVLPAYVFGYYSGTSGRFNDVFSKHEELYYKEQITGVEAPLRPAFLAKPHHSQFALLSFFAAADAPAKRFLKEQFRITGLKSVLFILQEPYWSKTKRTPQPGGSADARFWGAGGKVGGFLNELFRNALAPMAGVGRRVVSLGQERRQELRYCFLPDEQALRNLAGDLDSKEFFARLESTIFSDLVAVDGSSVRIRIMLEGDEAITFNDLSEGEQQLLTIIGLMRFTAQDESLFLLDEPDTHLNPAWCLDYLQNLTDYGVEPRNSQIIMTTHSPLTFAGLNEDEVVILDQQDDGSVSSHHPLSPPKGMGFQAILTSDFFKLRSAVDRETLEKLDAKRELGLKPDKTDDDRAELTRLDKELGKLDFTKAARDPLYLEFVRAMTEAQKEIPEIARPAPSNADWHTRRDLAKQVSARLLKEGGNA